MFKGDDNEFHTIGQCPPPRFTDLLNAPHNPYKMKYDGQDNIPVRKSAASTSTSGNADTASAGYPNLGTDPNLTPAGNSWEPIAFADKINSVVNSNLNPALDSSGTAVNFDNFAFSDSQFSDIVVTRNQKNRRSLA